MGNTAGQRLARLLQQLDRRGAEEEEVAGSSACAPTLVDDAPQRREESGGPVDFVEDDQTVGVALAVVLDVGQLREVAGAFQIEVGGASSLGDLEGQRRLAHLADAGEDDRRRPVQQPLDGRTALAWYHPRTPWVGWGHSWWGNPGLVSGQI